jgi:threonine synthase
VSIDSHGPLPDARSSVRHLRCTGCGAEQPLDVRYKCPACGAILDVVYQDDPARVRSAIAGAPRHSLWDFAELLPITTSLPPATLGEGWTPLLAAERSAAWAGIPDLWLKLESSNPTGSFKDRPVSVAVHKAREWGVEGVITASSGNAGAAVAAFAARAGVPAIVLVPADLTPGKAGQIALHGPRLLPIQGHFSRAYELASAWAQATGWYNVTSTLLSAFPTEGNKTVAYEIVSQLGRAPDWTLIPVSSGPLLVGAWKGFVELAAAGLIDRLPRMVAVQAAGCAPIARAFDRGDTEVTAWAEPVTVARGIRDPLQGYADDGSLTLRRVRESAGAVIAVDDASILEAGTLLARQEGIAAEPTGAVAVAGLMAMIADGRIAHDETAVCLVTGHGLKDLEPYSRDRVPWTPIPPNLDAMRRRLDATLQEGEP